MSPQSERGCLGNRDLIFNWCQVKRVCNQQKDHAQWWEYVLLHPHKGDYVSTWRIRILYIHNLNTSKKERVWGRKALWLFSKDR